ncbi:hypothetical protein HGM15179_018469 [Zosterops borbonicus]|uniref:Membrane magnesium transporter n=1 Tax=Zosterops borbonicus TaxID=364589 RepID=A0A8K1FYZ0_9PASS|nr:hypothetical protein HGM15179_018469 [Zosterops borbonicus]
MAAGSVWKGLVGLGLFALAHAAFSAAQHRSYMRLTEKEDETLPIDIVLQTLLAFAVTCYGIAHIAGEFKDMDATSELKNKQQLQSLKGAADLRLNPTTFQEQSSGMLQRDEMQVKTGNKE